MSPGNKNLPAVETLRATLGPILASPRRFSARRDESIAVRDGLGRHLLVEPTLRRAPLGLLERWRHVSAEAQELDAIPVLLVPHLTRSMNDFATSRRINWIDHAGNASIKHPTLLVHIEGRRPPRAPWRAGVDPFTPRSAGVVRQLLAEPGQSWRQKELVESTGLSQPQVSKALHALHQMALVETQEDGRLGVGDPGALLDAWADAHRHHRQRIVPVHLTGDGIALAQTVHQMLEQDRCLHWFTGLPAAWAYDHFARFRLVSVFVDGDPEALRRDLGLRAAPRGANVQLIGAARQRMDIGAQHPDGLPCVHPAQVYVDLRGLPERASEAADHLRPLALGKAAR